jgi:hypothetical protein
MIGTIRKHSGWLWLIIVTLTIISFLYWGASPAARYDRGHSGGYGTIYGHAVTRDMYVEAQQQFRLYYWMSHGSFPEKSETFKREDMERETYVRLMLMQKAKDLGVAVSEDAVVTAANEFLRSLGRKGEPVPLEDVVTRVLEPEGLTVADLQNFLRSDLVIQQLIQTLGLSGTFVTPQEAGLLYDREHQEVSAQAVFFSLSNYVAQVALTPAAIADFYQKNQAGYREPDRMQVNYVAFEVTNYSAAAEQKIGRTNLDAQVESVFRQHGLEAVPGAKTPEEAKLKIRAALIQQVAAVEARQQANAFATELFAQEPVKADNFTAFAQAKKAALHTTEPFAANYGPEEISASSAFTKEAFKLNAEVPFAGPVAVPSANAPEAYYVIGLATQLPSAIPPLEQIRARVTQDYQLYEAALLAQRSGTNFFANATRQMAAGKTFAQAAVAAGLSPLALSPFSLSSQEVPEAGDRAELGQLKRAAFTTTPGQVANFVPTQDGGFVLFVQSLLPVDQAKKTADQAQFLNQIRRGRQNEAFNLWLEAEASRELRTTPVFDELKGNKTSARKP